VNIKDIRNAYAGKYQQIIEREIKAISQRATEKNNDMQLKFGEIIRRIQTVPKNIEELTETRKYISEIGVTIEKLKKEIDQNMRMYDIAQEFHHEFSQSENDDKWKLYGFPMTVLKTIELQSSVLEKQKE